MPSGGSYTLVLPRGSVTLAKLNAPHHTYAAVDISVPVGTAFYSVTSGTVTTFSDDRCGYGVNLAGDDGALYTYCHASQLASLNGRRVTAGTQLGLTGGPKAPRARAVATVLTCTSRSSTPPMSSAAHRRCSSPSTTARA